MCADIFGAVMDVDNAAQGSLIGAEALALEKLGVIGDVAELVTDTVRVIEPDAETSGMYAEKYKRYLYYYGLE